MYRVIEFFTDLQDNNHAYSVGDEFPRTGAVASPERIKELSGVNNKRGRALIAVVQSTAQTKSDEAEEKPEKPKSKKKSKE